MHGARIEFTPAAPPEQGALSAFLAGRFNLPDDAPLVAERHMTWKYWSEREDWTGPRSFTARHGGRIVAHAAVWPLRIRAGTEIIRAGHLIDWAASPEFMGAGIWLVRQIRATVPLLIATGGRDVTRRILPVIGFRPHGELSVFAKPVRPLGQAITTAEKNWKLPARLARNAMWGLPARVRPRGWSAVPMMPEALPEHLWPQPSAALAVAARDASVYRYFVDSPTTRHTMFGLERCGECVGCCCISFVGHIARIADFWLPSKRLDDWTAGFRAATAAAMRNRSVYEVQAWASTALGRVALRRAGFRERDRCAITLFGETGPLQDRELQVQMIDCDASFLADASAYLT